MHQSSFCRPLITALLLILSWSTSVFGAAAVSITPSGGSSFTIQGTNMDGVAGIQLDITYDATSLSTPTVTYGALVSGAMPYANTSRPGIIKMAIITTNAFPGSGQIATLSFAGKSGTGGITSANVGMIDSRGAKVAASATYVNNPVGNIPGLSDSPEVPFSQTPTAQPNQNQTTLSTQQSTTSTTTPTYLGTVTLPSDLQQQVDSQPTPSSTDQVFTQEPPTTGISEQAPPAGDSLDDKKLDETLQYVVYKAILERFEHYKGSKELSAMAALFEKRVAQNIYQEPAILLSDGKNKAILNIDIPARINTSPNFAVNGGTLVSFKQDTAAKGRWIVEVLPEAGTNRVAFTIIAGAEAFEFPLTVAPPVKTALALDENGWSRFLKEVGTDKAPLYDLNNDGVRNYMDEFVFVANYLARKEAPEKPVSTAKKPENIRSLGGTK